MIGRTAIGMLLAVGICGCEAKDRLVPMKVHPEVDGRLNDAAWSEIPVHQMVQSQDRTDAGRKLLEKGTCCIYREKETLYLTAKFDDSWIVTVGDRDGDDLYRGDCCEIFIKPVGQPYYWEIWISPASFRSVVKWKKKNDIESKGRLLDGREIQISITIDGTLNNGESDDNGWVLKAALPLPDIPEVKSSAWEILIARQNYDGSLEKDTRELISFPKLSRADFHLTDEYVKLDCEEKNSAKGRL